MRSIEKLFLSSLAGSLAFQPAFASKEPLRLKPSTKWISQWQDDGCRLIRHFGTDKEKVIAAFARYGPGEDFRLSLGGKPFKTIRPAKVSNLKTNELRAGGGVTAKFGADGKEQEFFYQMGSLGKKFPGFFIPRARLAPFSEVDKRRIAKWRAGQPLFEIAEITDAEKAAITEITISGRPMRRAVVLETGSLRAPFAAFEKCIDDLMTHWGIDVEKHRKLTRIASPADNYARWVRSRDYPKKMLREGQPALVNFRLSVDKEGKATQCHIQATTRPKEFDNAVCRALMKRTNFHPALDARGNPVNSFWRSTVNFQIPRRN